MLRKLGFNPKTAEIEFMFAKFLEDDLVDTVELHEFLQMIEAKMAMGDDFEADIFKAFAALGHDEEETGICDFEVLREELFTWGEPFLDIEFVDFIRLATKEPKKNPPLNIEDGTFAYTRFVENMNNKDTRFSPEPINYFKLDQKTLCELANKKAAEEKAEQERKDEEKKLRDELRRQKLIADGLIGPDDPLPLKQVSTTEVTPPASSWIGMSAFNTLYVIYLHNSSERLHFLLLMNYSWPKKVCTFHLNILYVFRDTIYYHLYKYINIII